MKTLLALALMVALLAIGNTAAAGLFGVSMGDPIKPDKGWDARGYGTEEREYKGSLPFSSIHIEGTRKGGACGIFANHGLPFNNIRDRLEGKHGRPYRVRVVDGEKKAEWRFAKNPDKVAGLILSYETLYYFFDNYHECGEAAKNAVQAALMAEKKREAEEKAERERAAAETAEWEAALKAEREREAAEKAQREKEAAEKAQKAKIAKEAAKRANAPTCDRLKTSVLKLLKKKRDVLKIYKVEDYTGKEMLAIESLFSEEPEKIPLLKQTCIGMGRQVRGGIYGNEFEDHLDKKELKATRIMCFRPTAQIENDTMLLRLCKGTVRFPSNTRNIYFYSIMDVDGDVFTGYLYR